MAATRLDLPPGGYPSHFRLPTSGIHFPLPPTTPVYEKVFAFRAVPCYHAAMERLFDIEGPAGSSGSSRGRDARTHGNPAYYDKTRHLCGVV